MLRSHKLYQRNSSEREIDIIPCVIFPCCKARNVPYHKKVTGSSSSLHVWREHFLVYMKNLKVVIQIMYEKI